MPNRIATWIDSRPPRLAFVVGGVVGIVLSSSIWAGGLGISHYRERTQAETTYYRMKTINETLDLFNKLGQSRPPSSHSLSTRSHFTELDAHQQIQQKLDELSVFGVHCTN